ncbi:GerAB/ArcD/ProY family transporter, partial [Bacillus sp. JJ664]
LIFLVPTFQLVSGGIHLIAKYIETIFPFIVFVLLMLLFTLKDMNIYFILPIIKDGWMPIFKTIPTTTMSFLGIEVILIIYPYLKEKEKAIKGVIIANAMSTFTYLFVTLICFVVYSPYEISRIYEPVIDILSVLEFQYIERLDFVLLSLFLLVISKTWVTYLWVGMCGISELFKLKTYIYILFILFIVFILITYIWIPTFTTTNILINILTISGVCIIIGLPIMIRIGGLIQKNDIG